MVDLTPVREQYPADAEHLWLWCQAFVGIKIARQPVCRGHVPPFVAFARMVLERPRPPVTVWLANRGGSKSLLSALDTHLTSRWYPGAGTKILGGSLDQSKQIYRAIKLFVREHKGEMPGQHDQDSVTSLLAKSARYRNHSEVEILACSDRSVRGPHVPTLKLDEVDEISDDHRESAMGMCMHNPRIDLDPSALFTSTWHRSGGPMSRLMAEAIEGRFPAYTWCVFEVLERCPESRSGKWVGGADAYEHCPECPIRISCHADRSPSQLLPKAKRSDGHYSIGSLIQKVKTTSLATYKSDYLCNGPKTAGLIYPDFSQANVNESAEFDPKHDVYEAVDSGVFTGAVWIQLIPRADEHISWIEVHIFAEYLSEDRGAFLAAEDIQAVRRDRAAGKRTKTFTDPAGASRTSAGPVVIAEYERAGLKPVEHWPSYGGSVEDGIELVNSFIRTGNESIDLIVHPRCVHVIQAFQAYERIKHNGQFIDKPKDPQHPHEELMDAVRGCLQALYPDGRRLPPKLRRVHASQVF